MSATFRIVGTLDDAQVNTGFDRMGTNAKKTGDTIGKAGVAGGAAFGDGVAKGAEKASAALGTVSMEAQKSGIAGAGAINKFSNALGAAEIKGKGLSETISAIGKVALAGGLVAFAAAAYEGVKGAKDLQQQMEMIHTQAGKSQTEVTGMTKSILGMAASVGTNPQALAQGLYHIESAGFSGAKALNMLTVAAKGAKIGNADLTDTAQALAGAIYSNIPGAQNLNEAMGTLNSTVGAGDMTMQQLNEAFQGPMLATVKGYGLSLTDVGAALADFGDLNIRGADAATQLRMAVQYMAKPAATAGPALAQLGLNTQSFAKALAQGGLMPALQLLHDRLVATGQNSKETALDISDLFSKKGSSGVTILLNSLDRLKTKYKDVQSGAGSFGADWTATTKNLSFQWAQVEAGAAAFADKLGGYLIPKIEQLGSFVARNKTPFEDLAKVIGVVLVGAMAKFALEGVASFIGGVGKVLASLATWVLSMTTTAGVVKTQTALIDAEMAGPGVAAGISTTKIGLMGSALKALPSVTDVLIAITVAESVLKIANSLSGVPSGQSTTDMSVQQQNEVTAFGGSEQDAKSLLGKLPATVKSLQQFQKWYDATGMQNNGTPGSNSDLQTAEAAYGFAPAGGGQYRPDSGQRTPIGAIFSQYGTPTSSRGKTTSSGGGSNSFNPLAGGTGTSTASTALTAAQVAMQLSGDKLYSSLATALKGGTSLSQQPATLAALRSATSSGNAKSEQSLTSSLGSSGNSTLTALAGRIQSEWAAATSKIVTTTDADTQAGYSKLATLQTDAANSNAKTLKTDLSSVHKTQLQELVSELTAAGTSTDKTIVKQLTSAWTDATKSMKQQNADVSKIVAADQKNIATARATAQTTIDQDAANAEVTSVQNAATQLSNAANATAAMTQLVSQAATNASNAQVQIAQLTSTQTVDAMTAATNQITLAATAMHNAAQAQSQYISDQTQGITDSGNAQVQAIQDQTQTTVDTINERGKWGLDLVAQQQQVALDQVTATNNAKISAQIAHNDAAKLANDSAVAAAQASADSVAQQTAQMVAAAQASADTVAITGAQNVAMVQASVDAVAIKDQASLAAAQAHADAVAITDATSIATLQNSQDNKALADAIAVAKAQAQVDAVQFGTAAQTNAANAALNQAQAIQANDAATYGAATQVAENTQASDAAKQAQLVAAISNLQATDAAAGAASLAQAQSQASQNNQNAQSSLAQITASAAQQNQNAQDTLQSAQDYASITESQNAQTLAQLQTAAATQEATLKAQLDITQAMAATQFAGSGMNVFITGVPLNDAAAIGSEISWIGRSLFTAPVSTAA